MTYFCLHFGTFLEDLEGLETTLKGMATKKSTIRNSCFDSGILIEIREVRGRPETSLKAFEGLCPVFSGLPAFEGLLKPFKAFWAEGAEGGEGLPA